MLLKIACLLTCRILGLAVLVFRGDRAKMDADLLVLRRENVVLRRKHRPGAIRAGRPGVVRRERWTGILAVTPAALLAWHRKLTAKKYDTSKRRKAGRPDRTRLPLVDGPLGRVRIIKRLIPEDDADACADAAGCHQNVRAQWRSRNAPTPNTAGS